jgi:hypothetical protein
MAGNESGTVAQISFELPNAFAGQSFGFLQPYDSPLSKWLRTQFCAK